MIDTLKVGGVENQLLLLIKLLDRKKILPYICLLNGETDLSRSLEPTDCPVIRLGVRSLRHPTSIPKAFRLARFLRQEKIEILQLFFADSTYFGIAVAKTAGVPCIVRSRLDIGFWVRPIDRFLGRICSRLANATLVNCEAARESVIRDEKADRKSIVSISNGLDLNDLQAIPQTPNARTKRPCIGMVANLSSWKRHDLLLKASHKLLATFPDIRVHIAGEGPQRKELEGLIKKLSLQDHVSLSGRVNDIPSLLKEFDIAVLCSDTEGAPNAIMEYMAAARPIVATSVGGITELIEHDEHGLLIPPGSVDHLADAIARLLSNPKLAQQLATNARQRAIREYGSDVYAKRYEDFYCELSQRQSGRISRKST